MKYSIIFIIGNIFLSTLTSNAMESPYDCTEDSQEGSMSVSSHSTSGTASSSEHADYLYASSSESDDVQALVDYMMQDLYSAVSTKSVMSQKEPEMVNKPAPAIIANLKRKPSRAPVEDEDQFLRSLNRPMSLFKQQLIFHDRLVFDKETRHIIPSWEVPQDKIKRCSFLVQKLLMIARMQPLRGSFSSWLMRSEENAWHIHHPLHLLVNYGLNSLSQFKLTTQEDQEKIKEESRALGYHIEPTTDQDHILKCIEILTDLGANPDAHDHLGRCPLYLIATGQMNANKDKDVFKELVAARLIFRNANLNNPNNQGDTPLTRAAQVGDSNFMRFLLLRYADPNIQVNKEDDGVRDVLACGTSPLWAAAAHAHNQWLQDKQLDVTALFLLLEHNAKIKASEVPLAQQLLANTGNKNELLTEVIEMVIATRE